MPATRKAPTKLQESLALLSDPHLYRYFDELASHREAGTPPTPTDLACYIEDVETRVYGNRQKVEAINRVPETWAAKRRLVRRVSGRDLPATAPSALAVRKWRTRWVPPLEATDPVVVPMSLAALVELSTELGAKRARKLGQYERNRPRNFADPSPRHTVCMDGTWLTPYSRAKRWTDPEGQEHKLHSRAKTPAGVRQQRLIKMTVKDGRRVMGINHVVGITRTKYGRVFLGVERALRGENIAALELTERIIRHTGDGLHSLTYDKGFHGWTVEWLAAKYGVQVVLPAKVASAKKSDEEKLDDMLAEQELRLSQIDAEETLRRTGNKPTTTRGDGSKVPARKNAKKKSTRPPKILTETLMHKRQAIRHDLDGLIAKVDKGLPTGHGLPLGTSHYVSSQKRLVTIKSQHAFYRNVEHAGGDGRVCPHAVYVDDGAFWEARWTGGQWIKTQRVTCLDSVPEVDQTTGMHRTLSTHQLICYRTGEILEFDAVFEPRPWRRKPTDKETAARSAEQRALALMQPVARCDQRYRRAYGLRNEIESWFSDLKTRLLEDKRAASLDLNHQLLDVLYAGIVTNALALRTYRYEH
ncbi:hypothetical protein ACT8ZV_12210 [Nocardioides sp. MAHUQ-72]|uniref:hypothetical protein n=1 Tax=unclassified Nocardioides TaxID=2615069 RepID=UPI00360CB70D